MIHNITQLKPLSEQCASLKFIIVVYPLFL